MDVYILQHLHIIDDDCEDVKLIGIYSSEANAAAGLERVRHMPGFCDDPSGFSIACYKVDEDHWAEGYVTVFN